MGLHRWGPDAGLPALNWSWLSALSTRADAARGDKCPLPLTLASMHDNCHYHASWPGENMTLQPLHNHSGELSPAGLTLQDQRRIQDALDGSTSPNTRRAYNQAWRRFEAWGASRGRGHSLPASPELVAAFLAELAEAGKSVATLRLTKSALAAVHRSTGHQDPTDNEGVKKVMAGIARANGRPQRQAKPLTETALAAVKATAGIPRRHRGRAIRAENAWDARRRGQVDVALLSVLRDGLLRRSEASALRWGDVDVQEDGSARLHVRRSKTDPEAEGAVLYIGSEAAAALVAIMPEGFAVVDPSTPVFELSESQIGRRVNAAAKAAGLGDGFTGHSGRVGMAQDLAAAGVELPALMNAGRWKSPKMPARYTEGQAVGRGAVARYYQRKGG